MSYLLYILSGHLMGHFGYSGQSIGLLAKCSTIQQADST